MTWQMLIIKGIICFNYFVLFYFLILNTIYLILFVISLFAVLRFVKRTFFSDYIEIMQSEMTYPITVLVPAHNEEKTIVGTIKSLMMLNYSEYEIIIINDGSQDKTLETLVGAFEMRKLDKVYRRSIHTKPVKGIYASLSYPNIFVIDKEKGGKADALNSGINLSKYPLFCSVDADSIIEDNALLRVVKPFMEYPDETVASGGIVRIVNGCEVREGRVVKISLPDKMLPIFQVVEYLRAFLTGRIGWSALRSLLIISGAFGLYKKSEVIEIGGYDLYTDTEDLELVVRLHEHMHRKKKKYKIVFVPDPVCWTEVPTSLKILFRQRNRWHRGLIQTLIKHFRVLFNPRHKALGLFAFPYFFIFEMLGPFVEVLGYIVVILSFIFGILNVTFFVLFLTIAIFYGIFLSIAAILLEEFSFRRYPGWLDLSKLIVFGILENFGFRQLLAVFKIKAFLEYIIRRRKWGKMERVGFKEPATVKSEIPNQESK